MAADAGAQIKSADGRVLTVVQHTTVRRHRVRTVTELSLPRLMKLVLLWLGVPVGAGLIAVLPPDGPARLFIFMWFVAGLATLALNAAGVVTLRARKRVPNDGEDGT
ncbi:MAG TPA: hypothetical protein VMP03_10510 [Methylomirabilota bacterium]|nr:hypothetical protein [Methylomirabilota bacterium]